MNLGFGEIVLIILVLLLVFGASKLPQLGDALGKGIRNFKRSATEEDSVDITPKAAPEGLPAGTASKAAPGAAATADKKA